MKKYTLVLMILLSMLFGCTPYSSSELCAESSDITSSVVELDELMKLKQKADFSFETEQSLILLTQQEYSFLCQRVDLESGVVQEVLCELETRHESFLYALDAAKHEEIPRIQVDFCDNESAIVLSCDEIFCSVDFTTLTFRVEVIYSKDLLVEDNFCARNENGLEIYLTNQGYSTGDYVIFNQASGDIRFITLYENDKRVHFLSNNLVLINHWNNLEVYDYNKNSYSQDYLQFDYGGTLENPQYLTIGCGYDKASDKILIAYRENVNGENRPCQQLYLKVYDSTGRELMNIETTFEVQMYMFNEYINPVSFEFLGNGNVEISTFIDSEYVKLGTIQY